MTVPVHAACRQPRRRSRLALAAIAAASLWIAACEEPSEGPTDGIGSEVLFALDREAAHETLVRTLAARQRELFDALTAESRAGLTDYLDPAFTWNATTPSQPLRMPRADANYLAMLGGFRPASLERMPTTFSVYIHSDDMALVYAELPSRGGGIITSWRRADGGWRAVDARDVGVDLRAWESWMRGQTGRGSR